MPAFTAASYVYQFFSSSRCNEGSSSAPRTWNIKRKLSEFAWVRATAIKARDLPFICDAFAVWVFLRIFWELVESWLDVHLYSENLMSSLSRNSIFYSNYILRIIQMNSGILSDLYQVHPVLPLNIDLFWAHSVHLRGHSSDLFYN